MFEVCTRPENTRPVVVMTTLEGDDVTVAKCKAQPENEKYSIEIFCDEMLKKYFAKL